jgi:hypothetical protein
MHIAWRPATLSNPGWTTEEKSPARGAQERLVGGGIRVRSSTLMGPRKALRLLVCVVSFSLTAGCTDACIQLANQICSCQLDVASVNNCEQLAQQQESLSPVRDQDEKFCQQKLDQNACDCHQLDTPEGRVNCGISFAP